MYKRYAVEMLKPSYLPPPSRNSHKSDNKIIEKAYENFLKTDAAHAEKLDIRLALDYIHENLLSDTLSVKDVIEKNNIKTHCFHDRFADEVTLNGNARRTPGEYITWARMQVARRILEHGACNMTDLGHALGFNSYTTFWRAFRKHLGCKPSEAAKVNGKD
ncbi:MAG: helix-turn-helix transcriptional regulator [Bacteroidetes bacterium SB0662_bin_6]|nr:helix-turn-helix transcriptional regulator [Bacteroidetes bacterium SB0668_bin_1]MYE03694.1 helix-turn-helix transcriptional regulator [Bacteroidetes bacterium SB0662_bin_6]